MELKFRQNQPDYLEIEFVGEDYGLPDALRELLVEEKDVEFVACKMEHPQVGNPILYLRTKGKKALDLLEDAVATLKKEATGFKSAIKAAKKAKSK